MEKNLKKLGARDLISDLPNSVIENIIDRLDVYDIVRTSILSREWRYKWVTVPSLVFHEECLLFLSNHNLESIVSQVLSLHKGPITTFELNFYSFDQFCPSLDDWIHFLSKCHLKNLSLNWPSSPSLIGYNPVPSNVFTLSSLRHLYLTSCEFWLPYLFEGFSNLLTLSLVNVDIEPDEHLSLISKSPCLMHLHLENCNALVSLKIDAPKLKSFYFDGGDTPICFVNSPLLADVSISLHDSDTEFDEVHEKKNSLMKALARLPSITKLKLLDHALESVAIDGLLWNLDYDYMNQLKILYLNIPRFEPVQISCAIDLMSCTPNLERLAICVLTDHYDQERATQYLKEQRECDFSLNHLKAVEIARLRSPEPLKELGKLILSFATSLEKLYIVSPDEDPDLVEELVRFQGTSGKAKIIVSKESVYSDFRCNFCG